MPLVAKRKTDGKRIDITTIDDPRSTLKVFDIICPHCNAPMIICQGDVRIKHFRHKVSCISDYEHKPESIEHLMAKEYLANKLRMIMPEVSGAKVEIEYPFPEIKRIADVAIIFPMGWIEIHEIQLSSITVAKLKERTDDYFDVGADVKWWLGGNAFKSKENRNWVQKNFEELLILDVEATEETTNLFNERV